MAPRRGRDPSRPTATPAPAPTVPRGTSLPAEGEPGESAHAAVTGGWAVPVATGALAALVYATTVCPAIYWDDSVELVLVARELGIAHPTGYPLYTLLTHLFTLLPAGTLAYRVGLVSVLGAGLGVALSCRAMILLCASRPAAAAGALALAFSLELWDQATVAEVYGLHLALVAALHVSILSAFARPTPRRLCLLALLVGLSCTHHLKSAFTGMAVVLGLLLSGPTRASLAATRPARLILLAALPLTLYAVLPLRSSSGVMMDLAQPVTARALIEHVRGKQFAYRMFHGDMAARSPAELSRLARVAVAQPGPWWPLGALAGVIVVVGTVRLHRGRPPGLGVIVAGTLVDLVFTMGYNIPDKDPYYIPIYLLLTEALAAGLCAGWPACGARPHPARPRPGEDLGSRRGTLIHVAASVAAVLLPLGALVGNHRLADHSRDTSMPDYAADLVASTQPGSLLVVDDLGLAMALAYRHMVEGRDLDRAVVCSYLLRIPGYLRFLSRLHPDLALPAGLGPMLARGLERIQAADVDVGEESQRLVESIEDEIVAANIGRRPVFVVIHAHSREITRLRRWYAQERGLCYRLSVEPAPRVAYPAVYADPARYRTTEVPPGRRAWVARRYSTALNRLGIVLIGLRRLGEAERALRRALLYEPTYAGVYVNLGVLYSDHLGRADDAVDAFRTALRYDPGIAQAQKIHAWCEAHEARRAGRPTR